MQLQKFNTLLDLLAYFKYEQVCREYLELFRWPEHSWSNKHLQKYLDEFVFRYNTRQLTEADRFNLMLSGLANHLPYSKLIEDEKQQPVKWFDSKPIDRTAQYQQGSFGF